MDFSKLIVLQIMTTLIFTFDIYAKGLRYGGYDSDGRGERVNITKYGKKGKFVFPRAQHLKVPPDYLTIIRNALLKNHDLELMDDKDIKLEIYNVCNIVELPGTVEVNKNKHYDFVHVE